MYKNSFVNDTFRGNVLACLGVVRSEGNNGQHLEKNYWSEVRAPALSNHTTILNPLKKICGTISVLVP